MRALALDIGNRTIGIAASDLLGITAQGVETLQRTSNKNDLQRLKELVEQFEVTTFVIGFPKNMDGTEGELPCRQASFLGRTLEHCCGDEKFNRG